MPALAASLSRFVYGTTRLGHAELPRPQRLAIARQAMRTGVWFHTSRQYNDALEVLGEAFEAEPDRIPSLIIKLGNNSLDEIRSCIRDNITPLGVQHIDVGQLCLGGALGEDFARGGPALDDLRRLRDEGLVRSFILEVFPWTSQIPLEALAARHTEGLIDGFVFYLNPLQRFASNPLWDLIRERRAPVIAMRTVCGAPVHALRDVPGAAWVPYLQQRAAEVAPIFEASGIADWTEFCVRFAFSFPEVIATVGSSSRKQNLDTLLAHGLNPRLTPLPHDTLDALLALQRRWSAEVDVQAEPWTM